MKYFLKTSTALLLSALVTSQFRVQAASDGVPPEIEKAVFAEDWKAVADFAAPANSDKPSPMLRFLLGHACLALNRNNESVRLFRDTGQSGDSERWQAWTEQFVRAHPDSPIAAYLHGDALARQGEHERAIGAFSAGLRLVPKQALLLNARAVCYASMHKWNEAIVDLDDAARARPDLGDAHANLGDLNVRRSLGAPGALAAFDRALKISPEFVLAKIGRASALYGLGKWTEAQTMFDECKLDSDSGHLAALNASLVRTAASRAELAALDEKTAGVALTKVTREVASRMESANRETLQNDMGKIANTFVADTFRDISQPIKAVADTFKGVMDLRKGDIAGAMGKLAGVGDMIGKNAQNIGDLHNQLSKQSVGDWNRGMAEMQKLRSSKLQGGVSTDDLRRGFLDKGEWRLLARFALQYPEETPGSPATAQIQTGP